MALYRLYDASDVLLYVGMSNHPEARSRQHISSKPWGGQVRRTMIEWLDCDRTQAHRHEVAVIEQERPVYNVKEAAHLAVRDEQTGELIFRPNPCIPKDQLAVVTSRITKAEKAGAAQHLPEGEHFGRYFRACVRALQNEPDRMLELVANYWPASPETVVPVGRSATG